MGFALSKHLGPEDQHPIGTSVLLRRHGRDVLVVQRIYRLELGAPALRRPGPQPSARARAAVRAAAQRKLRVGGEAWAAAATLASDAPIHPSHDRPHVVGAAERQPDRRFNGLKLDKLTRSLMFGPPSTRRQALSRAQAPPEAALVHVSTDPGAPLAGFLDVV